MSVSLAGESLDPRALLKRALALGRIVLLIAALLALALLWLWVASPTSIDRLDALLKERHAAPLQDGIAEAKREIDAGNTAGAISLLEGLLEGSGDVRSQDRLASKKRKVFGMLADLYAKSGDSERAMVTHERWLDFSPRDVTAATRYAVALYETGGRREEGADRIRGLWLRFPDVSRVVDSYIRLQIEGGEIDEAYRALLRYGKRNPESWRLMWDTGEGFERKVGTRRSPSRMRGGRFAFDVAHPEEKARGLRVEAPGGAYFVIDAVLEFSGGSLPREIVLDSPDVLASDDLRRVRDDVFRSGKKWWSSHWTLLSVDGAADAHPTRVRFSADLVPALPRAATELLATWPPPPGVAADRTYQLYRRAYPREIEELERKGGVRPSSMGQGEAASSEDWPIRLEWNGPRLRVATASQRDRVVRTHALLPESWE